MEKSGMRCPIEMCVQGTQVYKSSSMKRLTQHFASVHRLTHPNPLFVYCCPVGECQFQSTAGNFRVYYHLKAEHPDYCSQFTGLKYTVDKAGAPAVSTDGTAGVAGTEGHVSIFTYGMLAVSPRFSGFILITIFFLYFLCISCFWEFMVSPNMFFWWNFFGRLHKMSLRITQGLILRTLRKSPNLAVARSHKVTPQHRLPHERRSSWWAHVM